MGYFVSEVTGEELKKAKEAARRLRASSWWKRKKASGFCHYCGLMFHPSELTMDHIVPVVRGGKTVKSNVVPACKDCNNKKKYMLPIEWAGYLDMMNTFGEKDV